MLQYRVVVSEVYNILKTSEPLIRPAMFIGQSSGNGKGGLPQKKQLEVTYVYVSARKHSAFKHCETWIIHLFCFLQTPMLPYNYYEILL